MATERRACWLLVVESVPVVAVCSQLVMTDLCAVSMLLPICSKAPLTIMCPSLGHLATSKRREAHSLLGKWSHACLKKHEFTRQCGITLQLAMVGRDTQQHQIKQENMAMAPGLAPPSVLHAAPTYPQNAHATTRRHNYPPSEWGSSLNSLERPLLEILAVWAQVTERGLPLLQGYLAVAILVEYLPARRCKHGAKPAGTHARSPETLRKQSLPVWNSVG
jgi:hypothetical protein